MGIECGDMDLDNYRSTLQSQLEYEQLLLKRVDEDDIIKNKNFVKKRIQNRIDLINADLSEEIEEDMEEENEEIKEEIKSKEDVFIQ